MASTRCIRLHYRLFGPIREIEGEGWALPDRVLGWVREAGSPSSTGHAAPGGQTGIKPRRRSGYPLMFYVPRDAPLTVKLWRAIAGRYRGNPVILPRHPERADRALSATPRRSIRG
jgi:hypothetical protein